MTDFVISNDLIVFGMSTFAGGQTFDGQVILDLDNTEALLVRQDGDGGDVFNVDTVNSLVQLRGGAALEIGSLPAVAGSIRLSNTDSITARRLDDAADLNILSFGDSNEAAFGDSEMPVMRLNANRLESNQLRIIQTQQLAFEVQNDGNDQVFVVDTTTTFGSPLVRVIGGTALTIGTLPALSGSIRLANIDSITFRNNGNDGDLIVIDFGDSNEMVFGDSAMPIIRILASRLESNRLRITHTHANALEVNEDGNGRMFRVDTDSGIVVIGQDFATGGTVDRFIIDAADLSVNSTKGNSHQFLMVGKARTSGGVNHDSNWRWIVVPSITTAFDGQSDFILNAAIDGATPTNVLRMSDNGRFAISQPEQVTIGSDNFIDNVQVHITGSFVDDYGGGPTETHKLRITGSQTGDSGRTSRQTIFDLSNASIITQNLSQTISEVGGMSLNVPSITPGTDTITLAYNLKLKDSPASGAENYVLLVDDTTGAADAYVRIGKSQQTGLKLLVGGGPGAENLDGNAQMRLTNFFSPDGTADYAALLHVHSTLQATDGTTDHITGAFFEGSLRTQVEADENVANISQVRIDEPNIQDNLTGTGEITNAQSLLITGAPTEGESNYALRILDGDLQIANASVYLFRNAGDSADLTALSMGASNFLEIGGAGAAEFERVSIFSLGSIRILPTDDLRVLTDSSTAFAVRTAGSTLLFQVTQTQTTVSGNLTVSGAGPHAIAGAAFGAVQLLIGDTFTSDGASNIASGLFHTPTIVGAPGDTAALTGTTLTAGITTQTATESIANIAQLQVNEPFISDNLTGDITNAQTLLITGAPTEGLSNFAIRVISGSVFFGGTTTTFGRIKTVTRQTTTYTILVTDSVVFGNTDSAGFTATLPAGVSGQTFKVINSGSSGNILTVTPDGSEDLLGVNSSFSLFDGEALDITFDSTDGWY